MRSLAMLVVLSVTLGGLGLLALGPGAWAQGAVGVPSPAVALRALGPSAPSANQRVTLEAVIPAAWKVQRVVFLRSDTEGGVGRPVKEVSRPPYIVTVAQPAGPAWYHLKVEALQWSGESRPPVCVTTVEVPNGITVSTPKLYDQRCLRAQIEDVVTVLKAGRFPDPSSLFGAVGRFQGGVATQSGQSFSLAASLLPTGTGAAGSGGAGTGTDGSPATATKAASGGEGGGDSSGSGSGSGSSAAAAPTPPTQLSTFSYTPDFGLSPQDTLQTQMELEYRLVNLRMILERSLTDRLVHTGSESDRGWSPRSQPVLGFDVSVQPLPQYRRAVAQVEVTVREAPNAKAGPATEAPFVIAMMPQSNTYNVASLKQSASSLGLGVVAKVFNLGYAGSRARQSVYLIKDIDTVASQSAPLPLTDHSVRFSWQFRPVLGQAYVQPGIRNVLVVLGLPKEASAEWHGSVEVRTCWRRLGRDGLSLAGAIEGSEAVQVASDLAVHPGYHQSKGLQSIASLIAEDAGAGNVAVTVVGSLDPSSAINLGSRYLRTPAEGLLCADAGRLKFVVPAEELFRNTPVIVDRYGTATRIHAELSAPGQKRLRIDALNLKRLDDSNCLVTLEMTCSPGADDHGRPYDCSQLGQNASREGERKRTPSTDLLSHLPLISLEGQVFGLSNKPVTVDDVGAHSNLVSFVAPAALLAGARQLTVQDLLWGPAYRAQRPLPPLTTVSKVTLVSDSKAPTPGATSPQTVVLSLTGTNLDQVQSVKPLDPAALPVSYTPQVGSALLALRAEKDALPAEFPLLLVPRDTASNPPLTVMVSLQAPPAAAAPPLVLARGDACSARLTVSNATMVSAVTLDGIPLPILSQETREGKTTVVVSIPSAVTAKSGTKVPTITYADATGAWKTIQKSEVFCLVVR